MITNLQHTCIVVAVCVDEFLCRADDALAGVGCGYHAVTVVDRSVKIKGGQVQAF
jgi:hypothetical protein